MHRPPIPVHEVSENQPIGIDRQSRSVYCWSNGSLPLQKLQIVTDTESDGFPEPARIRVVVENEHVALGNPVTTETIETTLDQQLPDPLSAA
jgi:hypothetical protein